MQPHENMMLSALDAVNAAMARPPMDHIDATVGTQIPREPPFEPEWAPRWVWDGDDSRWESNGNDKRIGKWRFEGVPPHAGEEQRLDLFLFENGVQWLVQITPTQAQAISRIISLWLESVAVTGGVK